MSGPAQVHYDSQKRYGGPVQPRDDSHEDYGGPAHDSDGSQVSNGGPVHNRNESHAVHGGPAWDPVRLADLRAAGEDLADLIEVRKAADNRARTLGHLDTELIRPEWIGVAEKAARQALQQAYQLAVPEQVREWASHVPGLASGELFPRIIAITGDPRHAVPLLPIAKGDTGRGARSKPDGDPYPRTLRQWWQYCGVGDPLSKPREDILGRKPSQADLLAAGKRNQLPPLLYTWSSQLVKMATPRKTGDHAGEPVSITAADSVYWKTFTNRKAAGAAKVHQRQCQNRKRPPAHPDGCGTVLHPEWGEPGSPWRPGHILMDAHRITWKTLLADLWRAAG